MIAAVTPPSGDGAAITSTTAVSVGTASKIVTLSRRASATIRATSLSGNGICAVLKLAVGCASVGHANSAIGFSAGAMSDRT